ncbi:SCF E3 ubiquitin ligase complex F-box protein grrA [Vanrija pseudolonga]|uniref:SCF E3 ubiquitin ligase complex F-box protein grrA n=1 Tax=Vanrija pseudolonga TaxID=143232 RepID=A0AAF0YB93_9TREE|nr:SCF E3 ubiquitin ligase complex F-box protein grrA [Vanrija pseudolonga]
MSEQDAERHSHDPTPRPWFNRQDEVSTPGGVGSSASTPLHPSSFFRKLRGRLRSSSESSASVSDSGILEDDRDVMGNQDVSVWPRQRSSPSPRQAGMASLLPAELLIHIMRYLPANGDLLSAMQVSRSWCLAGYPLLWQKPALNNVEGFASFVRVLSSPKTLLPYTDIIKRLSIAGFAREVNDDLFRGIAVCKRLERLTLAGAVHLTPKALNDVFRELKELIAIDVSGVTDVDDEVTQGIAANCPKTQGLNLTDCKQLTDEGVLAIAGSMKNLRRVRRERFPP